MAEKKSGSNPFDWGGLFQVIGIGVNAGASIHAANKNVELAKANNSLQLQLSGNQRFTNILAAMTEQRKSSLTMPLIIVGIVVAAFIIILYLKRK